MTLALAELPLLLADSGSPGPCGRPALAELPLLVADVPQALRQALSQEGVPWCDYVPGSRAGRFVLYDSTSLPPRLGEGQTAIDVGLLCRGKPDNPFQTLADEGAARFAWRIGPLMVEETVARVDRAAVRQRLLSGLRAMLEAAGGLWLRVSPFPHPYQTAFNFRVDHDDYDDGDFDATLSAVERHTDCVSHYVCASSHERHGRALARLRGMHVGSHGYWHHTYRDPAANLSNVRRGIDALLAAGVTPEGFAAPLGRFNRGLLAALESLSVSHSSEFGLAYDDLPFFPAGSSVLQVPIHPICLGLLLDAARHVYLADEAGPRAAAMALGHFQRMALEKHQAHEPIFFYGHPAGRLGKFPGLLRELFEFVGALEHVWRTTLAEFARWWAVRDKLEIQAVRREGRVEVSATRCPAGYLPAVEYWIGDRVATLPLTGGGAIFPIDAPAGRPRQTGRRSGPARFACRSDWRDCARRYLDWERATPLDEIETRTWRGWAKRTLREIKA